MKWIRALECEGNAMVAKRSQAAMVIFVLLLSCFTTASDLTPTHLRCEFSENPMGVDMQNPRLYWRVVSGQRARYQTAYRILVASTRLICM